MTTLSVESLRDVVDASALEESTFLLQHPGFCGAVSKPCQAISLIVRRKEQLVARCSFVARRRRGMTEWLSPLFASFGGVWCPEAQQEADPSKRERTWREVLEAIAAAVPSSVDVAEVIFAPGDTDARGLAWKGWELRPHYNYVSRWDEAGGWEKQLSSSTRRQLRKARESGLMATVQPASDSREMRTLWQSMATRQGLDPRMAEHLSGLGEWLDSMQCGFQMRVGESGDVPPQAMALIGFDASRVYYLAGASDPATLGTGAPTLLHAAIFEEIERRNLPRCYDWVGANTPGVAQFKKGFGPELEVLIAARRRSWKRRAAEALIQWRRG